MVIVGSSTDEQQYSCSNCIKNILPYANPGLTRYNTLRDKHFVPQSSRQISNNPRCLLFFYSTTKRHRSTIWIQWNNKISHLKLKLWKWQFLLLIFLSILQPAYLSYFDFLFNFCFSRIIFNHNFKWVSTIIYHQPVRLYAQTLCKDEKDLSSWC